MPKILISYRRKDSEGFTGRIRDRLVLCYGEKDVFMDVEDIPLGTDFRSHIDEQIRQCDVVLVVIGPKWFGETADGGSRLAVDSDPVRVEVETALASSCRTIPVLIDGAGMPQSSQVPESLRDFCFLNAAKVGGGADFIPNMERLIAHLEGPRTPAAWRMRARRALAALSLRKPLGRIAAVALVAIFGGSGAYANWERLFPPTERPGAVLLMPPEANQADTQLAADVMRDIWGPFFDGLSKQSRLAVIPNSSELYDPASKFRELFFGPQSVSSETMRQNVGKYADMVKRKVDHLIVPSRLRPQDGRIRLYIEIGSFNHRDNSFDPAHDLRVEVIGTLKRREVLSAVASYRIVRGVLGRIDPSPELQSAVAERFMKLFRDVTVGLDPEIQQAPACTTLDCLDELEKRLIDKAAKADDAPSEVGTAVEAIRLTTGAGQP